MTIISKFDTYFQVYANVSIYSHESINKDDLNKNPYGSNVEQLIY